MSYKSENVARETMSFRPDKDLADKIKALAVSERRSVSNVLVYIVNQYLSTSNFKLMKSFKIVPEEVEEAA